MNINEWIERYGIEKKDIPKTIILFKIISTTSYIGTFVLCYKYKPITRILKSSYGIKFNNYIIYKYPKIYNKIITTKEKLIIKIKNGKYIKKIPELMGMETEKFTNAFIENFFLYKLTLPLSLPVYIYLSIMYYKK